MRGLCGEAGVDYCDLLEQPLDAVAKVSGRAAEMRPGAQPPLDEAYFRRISAMEFAVKYDDGVGRSLARRRHACSPASRARRRRRSRSTSATAAGRLRTSRS